MHAGFLSTLSTLQGKMVFKKALIQIKMQELQQKLTEGKSRRMNRCKL